jgi:hypothetical protein
MLACSVARHVACLCTYEMRRWRLQSNHKQEKNGSQIALSSNKSRGLCCSISNCPLGGEKKSSSGVTAVGSIVIGRMHMDGYTIDITYMLTVCRDLQRCKLT